jgi:hypothetical protein
MTKAKKPLFPLSIADQVADVNAKQSYIISAASRLSISSTRLSELDDKVKKVNEVYARAGDKEKHSQLDTAELKIALEDCHELLRRIIEYSVKYNASSSVLPEDFEALNVYRPGTHEPLPDPTLAPHVEKATSTDNIVNISLVNPLNGKRGKPAGCRTHDVAYRVGGERPQDPDELTEHKNFGSSPVRLPFAYAQEDQPLYFAVRYIGTRGAFGPWSEIHKVTITR